jgi:hypothetical protein
MRRRPFSVFTSAHAPGLVLRESEPDEGFSTLDLVNGPQGVCQALDELCADQHDTDHVFRMAMAANVLSTMLANRVEGSI